MKTRKFNHGNLEVSTIGFGCMGLSHGYGATLLGFVSFSPLAVAF